MGQGYLIEVSNRAKEWDRHIERSGRHVSHRQLIRGYACVRNEIETKWICSIQFSLLTRTSIFCSLALCIEHFFDAFRTCIRILVEIALGQHVNWKKACVSWNSLDQRQIQNAKAQTHENIFNNLQKKIYSGVIAPTSSIWFKFYWHYNLHRFEHGRRFQTNRNNKYKNAFDSCSIKRSWFSISTRVTIVFERLMIGFNRFPVYFCCSE